MNLFAAWNDEYRQYIQHPNRSFRAELTYKNERGQEVELASEKIKTIGLSDGTIDGKNITLGGVYNGKATINLINVESSVVNALINGAEFYFKIRVLNSDEAYDFLYSDWLVVDNGKVKKRRNGYCDVTLTAYNKFYLMNKTFVGSKSKMTAKEIVSQIASKYGLSVNIDSAIKRIDGDVPTQFDVLEGFTDKQTLGYMAGCYGSFATLYDDTIRFGWYDEDPIGAGADTIRPNRVFDGATQMSEMEQRTIVMLETGTKDNPIVYPNNANGYSINFENPYITSKQAEAVYNLRISGGKISFVVGKTKYKGDPINRPGTIVTLEDINGESASFYIMKRTLRFDGGLSETIECLGESETSINYKFVSPTQQRIDRSLSRMEEAIKNATDIITQTKGSVFEFIPIDETDPTKGNSGWKLYSTDIGSKNVILANSSGIGFSSNGGQSFNAVALYIDKNGVGHINANCIDVGKLNANVIDTSTLVVSKGNVEGLDTELADLLKAAEDAESKANTAQNTANTANSTATTASTNASSALSVANSANDKIANWASANDTTLINGAKIYTGSITAEQIKSGSITADKLDVDSLTVGYSSGNIANGWHNPNGLNFNTYFTVDGNKITLKASYTTGTIRCSSASVYASAGETIKFGGTVYNVNAKTSGLYLEMREGESWNVKAYGNRSASGSGSIDREYTVVTAGEYRLTYALDNQVANCYCNNIYLEYSRAGIVTITGKIASANGKTYFDLDTGEVMLNSSSGAVSTRYGTGTIDFLFNNNLTGRIQAYAPSVTDTNRSLQIQAFNGINLGVGNTLNNYSNGINIDDSGTSIKGTFYVGADITIAGNAIQVKKRHATNTQNVYEVALGYAFTGDNQYRPCVIFNHQATGGVLHMRSNGGLYWNDTQIA